MPRRPKITATDSVDFAVYGIWDRLVLGTAADLDEGGVPVPEDGIFTDLHVNGYEISDLDLTHLPRWISQLREAEAGLKHRRLQLEALASERRCPACGSPVAGRSDRIYCSTACRVRANRAKITGS